jgi:hypothetical protein
VLSAEHDGQQEQELGTDRNAVAAPGPMLLQLAAQLLAAAANWAVQWPAGGIKTQALSQDPQVRIKSFKKKKRII